MFSHVKQLIGPHKSFIGIPPTTHRENYYSPEMWAKDVLIGEQPQPMPRNVFRVPDYSYPPKNPTKNAYLAKASKDQLEDWNKDDFFQEEGLVESFGSFKLRLGYDGFSKVISRYVILYSLN